jgi:hypothetical protein
LKDELTQEGGMLEELRPEIDAIKTFKKEFTESTNIDWQNDNPIDTPYTVQDASDTTPKDETKEESSTSEEAASAESPATGQSASAESPTTGQSASAESSISEQPASAETSNSGESASTDSSTEENSAPAPHPKTAVTDDEQADDAGKKP